MNWFALLECEKQLLEQGKLLVLLTVVGRFSIYHEGCSLTRGADPQIWASMRHTACCLLHSDI